MNLDELQISIKSNDKASASLQKLSNNLFVLSSALGNIEGSSMKNLASGIDSLAFSMLNYKASGISATTFNSLTKSLEKLSNVNTVGLQALGNSLSSMVAPLQSISGFQSVATSIKDLSKGISTLGNDSVQKATSYLPQLSVSLKDFMTTMATSPRVSQNLIDMTNALANFTRNGQKVGSSLKGMNTSLKSSVTPSMNVTRNVSNMSSGFKGLASAVGMFYVKFWMVIRLLKKFTSMVESAMDYIEAFNFFDVAITNATRDWKDLGYASADSYAKSFETRLNELNEKMSGFAVDVSTGDLSTSKIANLGINLQDLITFESEIVSITSSLGMCSQTAENTAKAFAMLTADMSSLHNIELDTVFKNFQSGLIGQSRSLYKYGLDITNATLSTYALANGVTKSVQSMTQAEKMQLRVLAIFQQLNGQMAQSQNAWTDLARTIEQPANQLRKLKNGFKNLGIMIGKIFLPVISKTLPYLNAMVIVLQRLADSIAKFFGISLNADSSATGTSDVLDEIEESAEDSEDALKSLNKQLSSFDKLNNLTTSSKSSVSDMAETIDLSEQIADAVSEYEKAWNDAFENIEDKATKTANAIELLFKISTTPLKNGFESTFDSKKITTFTENVKSLAKAIFSTFDKNTIANISSAFIETSKSVGKLLGSMLKLNITISNGVVVGLTNAIKKMKEFNRSKIEKISGHFKNIASNFSGISDIIDDISSKFDTEKFEKIVENVGKLADTTLAIGIEWLVGLISDIVSLITTPYTENSGTISDILQLILDIANELVNPLGKVSDIVSDSSFDWNSTWFHKTLEWFREAKVNGYGRFLEGIKIGLVAVKKVIQSTKDAWNGIKDRKVKLDATIKNSQLIKDVKDNWTSIKDKFAELKTRVEGSDAVKTLKTSWVAIKSKTATLKSKIENSDAIQTIKEKWDGLKTKTIKLSFDIVTKFEDIKNDIKSLINDIIDFVNRNFIDAINKMFKVEIPDTKITRWLGIDGLGGQIVKIGHIPKLKDGGFPKGENGLFYANSSELVGKFTNGKTAVANNDQIVAGIENGVYRAVTSAMANGNFNTSVTLEGDAKGIFNVVRKESDNYFRRNGSGAFAY